MRSHYKQAMDALALSPEARGRIQAKLSHPRRHVRFRPAVIAAAAVLVLALGATAAAGGAALHELPAAIIQSLQPVRLSDTDWGITMTVQSAAVENGVFRAYITLTDERGGDRLAQGVDFRDSYRIDAPFSADLLACGCEPLGYDAFSESYGYLVTIGAKDGAGHPVDFSGKKFTFSVRKLLWGQTRGQLAALRPDWSTVPPFPADTARYILGGSGEGFQTYSGWTSGGEALVLQPGGWQLQITDGVSISAAGFMGEQFHLQVRFDGTGPDDHGQVNLLTPEGGEVPCPVSLSFRDGDGTKYDEHIYDISFEELPGCTLTGEFTTGGYLLDGDWKVTFMLED